MSCLSVGPLDDELVAAVAAGVGPQGPQSEPQRHHFRATRNIPATDKSSSEIARNDLANFERTDRT